MIALEDVDLTKVAGGHPVIYTIVTIVFYSEGYRFTKKVLKKIRK